MNNRIASAILLFGMFLASGSAAAPPACDRRCMTTALDQYLAAMIAHSPKDAPLGPTARATENGVVTARGEGLWKTTIGFGGMQRRYFDPVSRQAAFYGTIMEAAGPALLSLRVRFDGPLIVETEAVIARRGEPLYNIAGQVKDQPRLERADPAIRPSTREAMLKTATVYFDALQGGKAPVPKVDGCTRVENGTKVTQRAARPAPPGAAAPTDAAGEERGGDCATGLDRFAIAAVAHRRFPVIDTEAGVILGIGLFQRPPGAVGADGRPRKRNLIHEYFAMDRGRMTEIFAVMRYIDAAEPDGTGW